MYRQLIMKIERESYEEFDENFSCDFCDVKFVG